MLRFERSTSEIKIRFIWWLRLFPPLLLAILGSGMLFSLRQPGQTHAQLLLFATVLLISVAGLVFWVALTNSYYLKADEQGIAEHDCFSRIKSAQWSRIRSYELHVTPFQSNALSGYLSLKDAEGVTLTALSLTPLVSARAKRRLIDFVDQRATRIVRPEHPLKAREDLIGRFRFNTFAILVVTVVNGYVMHYNAAFLAVMALFWLVLTLQTVRDLRRWNRAHPTEVHDAKFKTSPYDKR